MAKDQLLELLTIRRGDEELAELAIRLWTRGWDVQISQLRKHLAHALKVFDRVRRHVEDLGVVGYGEAFAERLRRRPLLRATYGITTWNESAYNRAVTIGQAVATQFSKEHAPITEEDVTVICDAIHLEGSERTILDLLRANLKDQVRDVMPTLASADAAVIAATNAELERARELWLSIHSLAQLEERLPIDHPMKAFVRRVVDGHDTALGFIRSVAIIQRVHSEGIDDVVQRLRTAFNPLYDAIGMPPHVAISGRSGAPQESIDLR
jgi:hypothetical protein